MSYATHGAVARRGAWRPRGDLVEADTSTHEGWPEVCVCKCVHGHPRMLKEDWAWAMNECVNAVCHSKHGHKWSCV